MTIKRQYALDVLFSFHETHTALPGLLPADCPCLCPRGHSAVHDFASRDIHLRYARSEAGFRITAAEGTQRVTREVQALTNKLTPDRLGDIVPQLYQRFSDNIDILQDLVAILFSKALYEHSFAALYAKVCLMLDHKFLKSHPRGKEWRKTILRACRLEFDKDFGALKEALEGVPGEEGDDARFKLLRRETGLMNFMGQLFLVGLVSPQIIKVCIERRLKSSENPCVHGLESILVLLRVIGHKVDSDPQGKEFLDDILAKFHVWIDRGILPPRIRCLVLDTIDLRDAGWEIKKNHDKKPPTPPETEDHDEWQDSSSSKKKKGSRRMRGSFEKLPTPSTETEETGELMTQVNAFDLLEADDSGEEIDSSLRESTHNAILKYLASSSISEFSLFVKSVPESSRLFVVYLSIESTFEQAGVVNEPIYTALAALLKEQVLSDSDIQQGLLEALRRYSDILLDFPLARKQLPWFLAHFLASSSLSPSIFDSDEFERLVPSGKAWDLLLQTLSLLRDLKKPDAMCHVDLLSFAPDGQDIEFVTNAIEKLVSH